MTDTESREAAFGRFNRGTAMARHAYDPEAKRASFEYGNPDRPEPRRRFSDEFKASAVAAVSAGEPQWHVAERIGVSAQTVSRWVTQAHREGSA